MRVGVVTSQWAKIGGVEAVVRELNRRWKEQGHEVYLITRDRDVNGGFEGFWDDVLVLPGGYWGYFRSFGRIGEFGKKHGIDVFHFHNTSTIFPGLLHPGLMRKSVLTLHGTTTEVYRNLGNLAWPLMWVFEEIALNLPAAVTSITRYHLNPFRTGRPVSIIRNGVDLEKFDPSKHDKEQLRNKFGFDSFTVLFLGKLVKQKGVRFLVEAAGQLPDTHFVIAGDGPLRDGLEAGARENVEFLGRVSEQEKVEMYAAADCFALPSMNEGLPLALLEAMAMGLPVVATRVGGVPELLEGQGELCRPKDPHSLANSIQKIKKEGETGTREHVKGSLGWGDVSKEYLQTFKEVLA